MAADWFYLCGSERVGPLSAEELRVQALAGHVTPETPVRRGSEGNWVPARKVKGLCQVPPPAPAAKLPSPPIPVDTPPPPPTAHAEPSHNSSPQRKAASGRWGISIVLFLIGGVLLVIAFMMDSNLDKKEKLDSNLNYAVGNFRGELTGRYDYKETKKQDRVGVYAVGGIGAIFILGGFAALGSGKR